MVYCTADILYRVNGFLELIHACGGRSTAGHLERGGGGEIVCFFPNSPPFGITLRYPFLAAQPQNFCKGAYDANISNFDGGVRAGGVCTGFFWSKFSKKVLKTPSLACFLKNLSPLQKILMFFEIPKPT